MRSVSRASAGAILVGSVALLCGSSSTAHALATYTYAGNDFTQAQYPFSTSMSLNGTVNLSSALGGNLSGFDVIPLVVNFTVANGVGVFTEADSYNLTQFLVDTNASGDIVNWQVVFWKEGTSVAGRMVYSCYDPDLTLASNAGNTTCWPDTFQQDGADGTITWAESPPGFAVVYRTPGVWTTTPVPEPSTALLFGMGLAGLGWRGRTREN